VTACRSVDAVPSGYQYSRATGQAVTVLAIDPGPAQSGWAMLDGNARIVDSGVDENAEMLGLVRAAAADCCAIEMIASYGMAVGAEVFETCVWIGRFAATWDGRLRDPARLIYRRVVKLHLCGSARAKDANIRQALLDRLGPQGTKKAPGPTYGVRSHAWAAVAVGVTAMEVAA